jgi:hypothetical protein
MVGTSGKAGVPLGRGDGKRAQLAALQRSGHWPGIGDASSAPAGQDRLHGIAAAAIGDVLEARAGALVEQLAASWKGVALEA